MRISLRVIVSAFGVFLVAVVAVAVLQTVTSITRDSAMKIGYDYTHSLSHVATARAEQFFFEASDEVSTAQRIVRRGNFRLPTEEAITDPNNFMDKWLNLLQITDHQAHHDPLVAFLCTDGALGRGKMLSDVHESQYMYIHSITARHESQFYKNNNSVVPDSEKIPYPFRDIPLNWFPALNLAKAQVGAALGSAYWMPPRMQLGRTGQPEMMIGVTSVLHNSTGHWLGVFFRTIILEYVTEYLQEVVQASDGNYAFVVDANNLLVASSMDKPIYNIRQLAVRNDSAVNKAKCSLSPITSLNTTETCILDAEEYGFAPLASALAAHDPAQLPWDGHLKTSSGNFFAQVTRINNTISKNFDLRLFVFYDEDRVLKDIRRGENLGIIISVVIAICAAILAVLLTHVIIGKLGALTDDLVKSSNLQTRREPLPPSAIKELDELSTAFNTMSENLSKLRSFVPHALMSGKDTREGSSSASTSIVEMPVFIPTDEQQNINTSASTMGHGSEYGSATDSDDPAGAGLHVNTNVMVRDPYEFKTHRGTIVLCTLHSFDRNHPKDAQAESKFFLSNVLRPVANHHHAGVVEIMSFNQLMISFGAHRHVVHHEEDAVMCALRMYENLVAKSGNTILDFTISIAGGTLLVGTCGDRNLLARVAAGEAVEVAQKMSALQRMIGSRLCVTSDVASSIRFPCVPIDVVAPHWYHDHPKMREVTIMQLLVTCNDTARMETFGEGFKDVAEYKYDEAAKVFRSLYCDHIGTSDEDELCYQALRLSEGCKGMQKKINDEQQQQEQNRDARKAPSFFPRREVFFDTLPGEYGLPPNNFLPRIEVSGLMESATDVVIADLRETYKRIIAAPQTPEVKEDSDSAERTESLFTILPTSGSSSEVIAVPEPLPELLTDVAGHMWKRSPEIIGSGAFSKVYRGIEISTGRSCAVKVMALQRSVNVESIVGEVRTLSNLSHPNVVAYVSAATVSSHFCLIMEYVPCGTLTVLMNLGPMCRGFAIRVMNEILDGLHYLHCNNVVHCDLKPDNILIGDDSTCKVADFGSSLILGGDTDGSFRGTPKYMAPERVGGEPATTFSDMWSFGLIVYEMLSGTSAYERHISAGSFYTALASGSLHPHQRILAYKEHRSNFILSQYANESIDDLWDIANRCCHRNAEERPTPLELLSQLQGASGQR